MPLTSSCPRCGEHHYHKSHSRNVYERIRKVILNQRRYRCHSCGYRGWGKRVAIRGKLTPQRFLLYITVIIVSILFGMLFKSFLM